MRARARARLSSPAPLGLDLATPEPVPAEGIAAATALLTSGRLFRYAEAGVGASEAALWEQEFAAYLGRRYAVAVNSCGSAMYLALHCLGVQTGESVLMNAWTLSPVPGAVAHVGAHAVLVDTTADLTIDLADLERRARAHRGSVLLLSHMRGHVADMAAVRDVCETFDLRLVEDCAHSLGAAWDGVATGTQGLLGCFSTQAYKHLNSGEGGVLATDDDDLAARAILASGSYALYEQHASRPPLERLATLAPSEANHSMRLTSIAAAVLRPQLRALPARIEAWNARYTVLAEGLSLVPRVTLPRRPPQEQFVGSSLQFSLDLPPSSIERCCAVAASLGVHVKWFGGERPHAFTSTYRHWSATARNTLPDTDDVLAGLCDIRVPTALPLDRCADVVAILRHAVQTQVEPTTADP